jgi:hypothetical protein
MMTLQRCLLDLKLTMKAKLELADESLVGLGQQGTLRPCLGVCRKVSWRLVGVVERQGLTPDNPALSLAPSSGERSLVTRPRASDMICRSLKG